MDTLEFNIHGSQPTPYLVEVLRHKDNELEIICDCPAGQNSTHCKHRIGLLTGDYSLVIYDEGTEKKLTTLSSWVPNTKIEKALQQLAEEEAELEKHKKLVKGAKRRLARIMEGG